MTRKPWFWVLFALLSAAAAVAAWHLFPLGTPLVALDIRMDRRAALARAEDLVRAHGLGPPGPAQWAATFAVDSEAQRFIELEAGGRPAFLRLMTEGMYAPYRWAVRRFREGDVHETWIRFTPAGQPYGFTEVLAEQDPGPALAVEAARGVAESAARRPPWNLDLSPFTPVSAARTERPGGRVDHRFVYERRGVDLGAGRLRLDLEVSGDRLTELRHYVEVPEAFTRRYAAMRSANDAVAAGGLVAVILFYVVLGCGLGVFFLLRQNRVLWRPALFLALVIAALSLAAELNRWPLFWIDYDTALSREDFLEQRLAPLILAALGDGLLVFLGLLGAENLSRRAFPRHPQLWRLLRGDALASREVLGRTLGGYLLAPFFLAYVSAFYALTLRRLGWWSPAETLADPDILAHALPWLGPLASSLHAGLWEECLFRAVPLAGAALLGERLGRRRLCIALAFVAQMVIFGAGHANYPAQPAYARLVELLLPSALFGGLYLVYGLLPGMVLHFLFDFVLFSLPILASSATTSRIDQGLLLVLGLVPLGVVCGAWWRRGRLGELPEDLRNRAWQPEAPGAGALAEGQDSGPVAAGRPLRPLLRGTLAGLGALGLLLLGLGIGRGLFLPRIAIDRTAAVAAALRALSERGARLDDRFQAFATVIDRDDGDLDHRLVWQTAGPTLYHSLLGRELDPPLWRVRFVNTTGDVAERAEQWRVDVLGDGRIYAVQHQLPEGRPGAMLEAAAARARVHDVLRRELHVDPAKLYELSAEPDRRPARVDWQFTFRDPTVPPLPEGERRILVNLAGDEPIQVARFVHAPEAWARRERQREGRRTLLGRLPTVASALVILTGGIAGIIAWSRRRFHVRRALALFALALMVRLGVALLSLPATMAHFSTAVPYGLQLVSTLVAQTIVALFLAAFLALGAGLGARDLGGLGRIRLGWGFAAGAFLGGVYAFLPDVLPRVRPPGSDLGEADALLPTAAQALSLVQSMLVSATWLYLVVLVAQRLEWRRTRASRLAAGVLVLALGFLRWNSGLAEALTGSGWLLMGLVGGLLLLGAHWLARIDLGLVPPLVSLLVVLPELRWAFLRPAPGMLVGTLLGSLAVVAIALVWGRALSRPLSV
ncbi:MAG TPA: CPBP family intramembrane glutamic endopeptidase [Polyangia bacterium]|nr:CPBP family intramembrane glutamic endopeptidase [Polyangia bacterium]